MSLLRYKYKIYPDKEQEEQLNKTFDCINFVYNRCLDKKIKLYKKEKRDLTKLECNNYINEQLKKEYEYLADVDDSAITNSIYNMHFACNKKIKNKNVLQSFPRFKGNYNNEKSYTINFSNNNIEVDFVENEIKIPQLKTVKAKLHRKFIGNIKSATITKTATEQYFIRFLVKEETIPLLKTDENKIEVNLGLNGFVISSNDENIKKPTNLKKYEEKLKIQKIRLSKKQKKSSNFEKQLKEIYKTTEKIENIRKDFTHKLSTQIITENQVIVVEDLNVKGTIQNNNNEKFINNRNWYELKRQLKYKSKVLKRTFYEIDNIIYTGIVK